MNLETIPYEDESYWNVIGFPARTPDSTLTTGDDGGRWAPRLLVYRADGYTIVRTDGEVGMSTDPWQHPGHPTDQEILEDYIRTETEAENE